MAAQPDTDWSPPFLADDRPEPNPRLLDRTRARREAQHLTRRETHLRRFRRALAVLAAVVALHVATGVVGGGEALGQLIAGEMGMLLGVAVVVAIWAACGD